MQQPCSRNQGCFPAQSHVFVLYQARPRHVFHQYLYVHALTSMPRLTRTFVAQQETLYNLALPQGANFALPSTAVRSVGVVIDQPPANTPPVITGACQSLSCVW